MLQKEVTKRKSKRPYRIEGCDSPTWSGSDLFGFSDLIYVLLSMCCHLDGLKLTDGKLIK